MKLDKFTDYCVAATWFFLAIIMAAAAIVFVVTIVQHYQ